MTREQKMLNYVAEAMTNREKFEPRVFESAGQQLMTAILTNDWSVLNETMLNNLIITQ